jgi:hypothetical protein
MLNDQSRDAQPESRYTTEVMMLTESRSAYGVKLYDLSHIFRPELGIRPESRPLIGVGYMIGVAFFDRSRDIPAL